MSKQYIILKAQFIYKPSTFIFHAQRPKSKEKMNLDAPPEVSLETRRQTKHNYGKRWSRKFGHLLKDGWLRL